MNSKKNLVSALLYQITHIIYGLLIPRIILGTFGSNINGLVSSITQFLGFVSLLEGGLGAIVLAELYSPIAEKRDEYIKGVLYSCQKLFSRLAAIFVIYTIFLAVIYSFNVRDQYKVSFVVSLTLILSLTTLAQYLFSITYKLYLQADQKIYITNYLTTVVLVVNAIIAVIVVKLYPEIRLLKIASCIIFFIQPLIYRYFIPKEYIQYKNVSTSVTLKNRWSGFAQNLAYYINMNTDIILITLCCSLTDVSIYTVYLLGINAIRSIVTQITNSYQSALGMYIAQKKHALLEDRFKTLCVFTWGISLALFCTCLLVINPFVKMYTNNVSDASYYQPLFAAIIILANLIYCLREPYRLLILAGGKFKETNFGSMMEALLNLGISFVLIRVLGLVGVAIGTFVAITYRMVYFIVFIKREMLCLDLQEYWRCIFSGIVIISANLLLYRFVNLNFNSLVSFVACSSVILLFEVIFVCTFFIGVFDSISMIRKILGIGER